MAGQDSYRPWGGQTQCGVALGVTQGRCGQGLMAHGSWPALPPAATRCRHRGVHSQLAGCLPASLWLARGNLCGVTARPSWATHLGLWGQWALPPCAYTADFTTGWDRMSRTQAAVITTDVTQPHTTCYGIHGVQCITYTHSVCSILRCSSFLWISKRTERKALHGPTVLGLGSVPSKLMDRPAWPRVRE